MAISIDPASQVPEKPEQQPLCPYIILLCTYDRFLFLTLPLSTMSLCRSLEDSTSTLMACIRSVQEARILCGAIEDTFIQHLHCTTHLDMFHSFESYAILKARVVFIRARDENNVKGDEKKCAFLTGHVQGVPPCFSPFSSIRCQMNTTQEWETHLSLTSILTPVSTARDLLSISCQWNRTNRGN